MVKYTQTEFHGVLYGHVYFDTLPELMSYVKAQFTAYQNGTKTADSALDNAYQACCENNSLFDDRFQHYFDNYVAALFVTKESYSPYKVYPVDLDKVITHFPE